MCVSVKHIFSELTGHNWPRSISGNRALEESFFFSNQRGLLLHEAKVQGVILGVAEGKYSV